jgi:hypothetical protein
MIQRIQSLYLLLTSLASILFLKGAFLTFFDNSGTAIKITFSGIVKYPSNSDPVKTGEAWPVMTLALLIPVLSLIIIFLYKNRFIQMLFARILILLISVLIGTCLVYTYIIISKFEAEFASWYKLIIPFIQLILSLLAYKCIKKDDDLVKSYDRLR